jgi:hypothetical protein
MSRFFHMDKDLFTKWTDMLLEYAYDWKRIGISDDFCNRISEPRFGLRLIDWQDKSFEVVNHQKYIVFLLRYQ